MTPIVRFFVLPSFANLSSILSLNKLADDVTDGNGTNYSVQPEYRTPEFAYTLAYLATKADLGKRALPLPFLETEVCVFRSEQRKLYPSLCRC